MDGEAEALHRQLHHDGCAVVTAPIDTGLVDNTGVRSPGRYVERRILMRSAWKAGAITVYNNGAVIVFLAPVKEQD